MTINEKATRFEQITKDMLKLYKKKNIDYNDSFGRTYSDLGIISAAVRISDKCNRFKSLCKNDNKVKDESILDTLIDLANYSIMTIIEIENENVKPTNRLINDSLNKDKICDDQIICSNCGQTGYSYEFKDKPGQYFCTHCNQPF